MTTNVGTLDAAAAPSPAPATVRQFDIKARTGAGVNYTAAFLLFCKGTSLREIAEAFDLNYGKLLDKARSEDWDTIAKKQAFLTAPPPIVTLATVTPDEMAAKEAKIAANRAAALTVAERLRKNILNVLQAYETENAFMRPDDILTLAKAAKLADDCSMVALGDSEAVGKVPLPGAGGNRPSIIINLPSAVAGPRSVARQAERAVEQIPQPNDGPAIDQETIPDDLEPPEPTAAELIEINVLSPASPAPEAVPAQNGRGFSVDFETLAEIARPANHTPDAVGGSSGAAAKSPFPLPRRK